MNHARQRRLTPVLAVLVVVLGALWVALLGGLGSTPRWDAPRTATTLPPATSGANLPSPVPLAQFALVWQKPLFSPDRKPAAHAADGGSSLGDLTLTGVILTRDLRMALLRDRQTGTEVRLRVGESLPNGGATLVELRARAALFDAPSGRTELKLPAGAPIDGGKADAASGAATPRGTGADAPSRDGGQPPDEAPVPPRSRTNEATPAAATPSSAVRRLRETINKRRAAQAAAANQGVR